MLATTLPAVHLITKSAHHSTGPPSYTNTGLQCTWPHRPRLAGLTKFQATPPLLYQMAKQSTWPRRTLLYKRPTIYLATPSLHRHYINRRPNTISGLTVLQQRWPKQMVSRQILICRAA